MKTPEEVAAEFVTVACISYLGSFGVWIKGERVSSHGSKFFADEARGKIIKSLAAIIAADRLERDGGK